MTRGGTRSRREPPKTCPSTATIEGTDTRVSCERTPDRWGAPWHDGPHRMEVGKPVRIMGAFGPLEQAQIATWWDE